MLFMFFVKRYEEPQTESQTTDDNQNVVISDTKTVQTPIEPSPRTRKILIALFALIICLYSCLEAVYFALCPTYFQYLTNVVISAEKAADIMIVMLITYTLGRLVSAFISIKLKPEVMMTYHLVIIGIALTILYIGQNASTTILIYVGNGIIGIQAYHNHLINCILSLGFGFSAMWSATYTLAENTIRLTDKITALFSFVCPILTFITPLIISPLIEKQPHVFMTAEISYFFATIVIFGFIMIIVKRSQRFPIMYSIN